jgi:hypothetical protein
MIQFLQILQRPKKVFVVMPLLLLVLATAAIGTGSQKVNAGGDWNGGCGEGCGLGLGFHHWGWLHHWNNQGGCCGQGAGGPVDCCNGGGPGPCCNEGTDAYQAGISDAVYDHQQNLAYNPIGSCVPCHSQNYWDNFHQGYDHQWQSYQTQESTQGSSINVINSPNAYVNTNQVSGQQQNPLQQLGHLACNIVNCNSGYQGESGE